MRAFPPAMRERGSGRIVNVSSVAGRRVMPLAGHDAATKHALEAMGEALRHEVRPFGVDVVPVEPGPVRTGSPAPCRPTAPPGTDDLSGAAGAIAERTGRGDAGYEERRYAPVPPPGPHRAADAAPR
ncbi:SDR family NAD(P)-dependent oxidoreductase [Thermobifida alba]|uniref:SDR family NAD(P)-dependent oxidoreductase n=1 Tax=Thermobifida alba TaxID=53522 RepID=UPI0020C036D2|nr:SDR family NAD(P)-dependent oxidoreductase [Thermobifida alba]